MFDISFLCCVCKLEVLKGSSNPLYLYSYYFVTAGADATLAGALAVGFFAPKFFFGAAFLAGDTLATGADAGFTGAGV